MPNNDHPGSSRFNLLGSLASIVPAACWMFGILPWWTAVLGVMAGVAWIVFGWPTREPTTQQPFEAQIVVPDSSPEDLPVVPAGPPADVGGPRYAPVEPATNDPHCPIAYREAFFAALVGQASHIPGVIDVAKVVRDWVDWQVLNYVRQHPAAHNEELRMAYFKKAYEELLAGRIAIDPEAGRRVARWVEQQAMERLRIGINSF